MCEGTLRGSLRDFNIHNAVRSKSSPDSDKLLCGDLYSMALSIPLSTTFVKTREAIKWHCYPRRGRLIALKLIFAALNRCCHSFRAVTKVQLVVLNIRHAEKLNYRWKETILRVVKHVFNCAKPSRPEQSLVEGIPTHWKLSIASGTSRWSMQE